MCGSILNKLSRSLAYQSESNLFVSRCFNNTSNILYSLFHVDCGWSECAHTQSPNEGIRNNINIRLRYEKYIRINKHTHTHTCT